MLLLQYIKGYYTLFQKTSAISWMWESSWGSCHMGSELPGPRGHQKAVLQSKDFDWRGLSWRKGRCRELQSRMGRPWVDFTNNTMPNFTSTLNYKLCLIFTLLNLRHAPVILLAQKLLIECWWNWHLILKAIFVRTVVRLDPVLGALLFWIKTFDN